MMTVTACISFTEPRKKSTNAKDEDIDDIRFLVKNLDTGETFNINDAEAKVEHGIDPLSLHLEKSQVCSSFIREFN